MLHDDACSRVGGGGALHARQARKKKKEASENGKSQFTVRQVGDSLL